MADDIKVIIKPYLWSIIPFCLIGYSMSNTESIKYDYQLCHFVHHF